MEKPNRTILITALFAGGWLASVGIGARLLAQHAGTARVGAVDAQKASRPAAVAAAPVETRISLR